jgi:hypothetical protein
MDLYFDEEIVMGEHIAVGAWHSIKSLFAYVLAAGIPDAIEQTAARKNDQRRSFWTSSSLARFLVRYLQRESETESLLTQFRRIEPRNTYETIRTCCRHIGELGGAS